MLKICKNADDLASLAADLIVESAREAIESRGRFTIALAGGSTPEKTYALLARPEKQRDVDWSKAYIFFGDERYVPANDSNSNFAMAQRSLLSKVPIPATQIFPVPTVGLSLDEAAAAYAGTLAGCFSTTPRDAAPRFDLILLGLGDDGHTASLFPGKPAVSVADRWVVFSPPGVLPPPVDRITFTFPVLNAARHVMFLIAGEKKAGILKEVLEGARAPSRYPASGVHPIDGTLTWLVDEAAAKNLTHRS